MLNRARQNQLMKSAVTLLGTVALIAGIQAEPAADVETKAAQLVRRVDSYYQLGKERRYGDEYEMLAAKYRRGEADKRDWIRAGKRMDNGIKVVDWRITSIRVAGATAKVSVTVRVRTRESLFRWEEAEEPSQNFWVYEDDDWYYIPKKLHDWDDSQAVEWPVPDVSAPAPRADIKVKD